MWRRPLDLAWFDYESTPMALDGQGNVLIVGRTKGATHTDAQVAKFDPEGNLLWQVACPGTTPSTRARFVAADANDRVHVTIVSAAGLTPNQVVDDVLLSIVLDSEGQILWRSEYATEGEE